jgi:hypothetical protein
VGHSRHLKHLFARRNAIEVTKQKKTSIRARRQQDFNLGHHVMTAEDIKRNPIDIGRSAEVVVNTERELRSASRQTDGSRYALQGVSDRLKPNEGKMSASSETMVASWRTRVWGIARGAGCLETQRQ